MNLSQGALSISGYLVLPNFMNDEQLELLDNVSASIHKRNKGARKNIFRHYPEVRDIFVRLCQLISEKIIKVKMTDYCFYLEKNTQSQNWPLALHRDLNFPEYLNLDFQQIEEIKKKGFWIRCNLDNHNEQQGALRIIPGSHLGDKQFEIKTIEASRGDIVLFSPMLLHGSNRMVIDGKRRIFQALALTG